MSLIQFLLDRGANPNIISSPVSEGFTVWHDRVGGTIFDQFAIELVIFSHKPSARVHSTIFKRLEAAGSEFSKPLDLIRRVYSPFRCDFFDAQARAFAKFEDQIDCLCCPISTKI